MNSKEKLNNLIIRFTNLVDYYKNKEIEFKEETCRTELINPFFKLLGWDIENNFGLKPQYREVMFEQNIGKAGRSDYTMTLSGVPVFFVETKKPSVDISKLPEPAFQVRRYGWSANLKISILTNFEYLIIYDTTIPPKASDNCNVAMLKKYYFKNYVNEFDEIFEILSKDTVYSGKFDKVLEKRFESNATKGLKMPVDKFFLVQINKWRIELGNYLLRIKNFPIEIINDVVQEFINQILFLRICEDKNLPLYHTLKEVTNNEIVLQKEMQKLFIEADKKYNSGLFRSKYIIFDLNSKIIKEIIEELYYPQSPYEFKLIGSNLLGQVYEIFLADRLVVDSSGFMKLENKARTKNRNVNRAIVTTPIEIVRYMVKKSLEPLIKGKSPDKILNLKIVDVACGSGIFLIEIFDYIIKYCVEWYKTNDIAYLITVENGEYKLPLEEKKQILLSCLYGIDIDVHAVEVAKFNLLIKLLEHETTPSIYDSVPVLPDLSLNIFHGNSLIDFHNIDISKLSQYEKDEILPFDWDNINYGNKFSLIISNPPYVNVEDMNNLLPQKEIAVYKYKYTTSYRQFDKYFIFLERALQKIQDGGYICYIIPNKFSKVKSGYKLRKLLTDNKYVVEYIDFGSAQLFKNKIIYSSILLIQKKKQTQFAYEEVKNISKWWGNPSFKDKMLLDSSILTDMPWVLVPNEDEMKLINKLYTNSDKLATVANLFNGIQTSAERPPVYWFSKKEIIEECEDYFKIEKFGQVYKIEKGILKKFFKPINRNERNLSTYDIFDTNKWIIFPYDKDGKLYPLDIMKNKFPHTLHYLEDRYDILKPKQIDSSGKRDVPNATCDTWYQYGRDQAFKAFNNNPKLIVGVLSKKPMYLYDKDDFVIASGGTAGYCAISTKDDSPYCLEYIQAYLTHPRTEWLLSIIGSDFEGDYYSRGTSVLEGLPIKKLNFKKSEHIDIYNNVIVKTKRIHEINKILRMKITKTQITSLFNEKKQLIKQIEDLITIVYSI
ncbi:N-6 DNA methylase [Clostridium sp. Mt-5]|uniref:site-specific DNA-methyltransferase (adenine-specific) n=1 Tax=Clostridium moutaii TaxID=3240932 RepID=A0ABV4BLJ9_9CLOT